MILSFPQRELSEEAGLKAQDVKVLSPLIDRSVPFDIDTHPIPANPNKCEPAHYHHDFRYLFLYDQEETTVPIGQGEADEYRWEPIEDLAAQTTFAPLVEKLWHLLSVEFRTKEFYHSLITECGWSFPAARSVVVCHMIPDCLYYLRAINQIFPILAIVPKPNSIDADVIARVEKEFECVRIDRPSINTTSNPLLAKAQATDDKVILFDIGGYFAEIDRTWPKNVLARVIMVVEDTENGHQKYEARTDYPLRVVSAARSPLKENEDFLVGQSVLFSADALTRTSGGLLQYMKCGVFGYGKIGRSIALHLQQRDVKPSVFDVDAIRRIDAYNKLCSIPPREEILEQSDVIFCATGNQALQITDFRKLKHGCLVFSVTSSDDEFELTHLMGEYQMREVKKYIYKFWNSRNFFFLVNKGNAVNSIHNAVMGPFIHLVRAEMIVAACDQHGALEEKRKNPNIYELSAGMRQRIAIHWVDTFDPERRQISNLEYLM